MSLDFKEFQDLNVKRCEEGFFPLNSKTGTDYGCAAAGEMGEACNLIYKHQHYSINICLDWIGEELADTITYIFLIASRLGIDMEEALRRKFNAVSEKRGSKVVI